MPGRRCLPAQPLRTTLKAQLFLAHAANTGYWWGCSDGAEKEYGTISDRSRIVPNRLPILLGLGMGVECRSRFLETIGSP